MKKQGSLLKIFILLVLLFDGFKCVAEEGSGFPTFKPVAAAEYWGIFSTGDLSQKGESHNNFDHQIRRLRFGAKGNISEKLKYFFTFHNDRLGESPYAATEGSDKGVDIWNAYLTLKILDDSELLNLHCGYFWAAISREFNTCPWDVSSFDKSYSTWFLRKFLTAQGNGIENGIALGGFKNFTDEFAISYRTGIYDPEEHDSPEYDNPLFTARVMFSLGEPEETKYKYMLSGNQWGKRKGLTLGLGYAYQGETDNQKETGHIFFDDTDSYGIDLLFNYKSLRIDGEYFLMNRRADGLDDFEGREYFIRASYLFSIDKYFLEPSLMVSRYKGSGSSALFKFIGEDKLIDIGINWYLNKDKQKLSMHYIKHTDTPYADQGEYVGLAFQYKL